MIDVILESSNLSDAFALLLVMRTNHLESFRVLRDAKFSYLWLCCNNIEIVDKFNDEDKPNHISLNEEHEISSKIAAISTLLHLNIKYSKDSIPLCGLQIPSYLETTKKKIVFLLSEKDTFIHPLVLDIVVSSLKCNGYQFYTAGSLGFPYIRNTFDIRGFRVMDYLLSGYFADAIVVTNDSSIKSICCFKNILVFLFTPNDDKNEPSFDANIMINNIISLK